MKPNSSSTLSSSREAIVIYGFLFEFGEIGGGRETRDHDGLESEC
jgi:hypothetical protein